MNWRWKLAQAAEIRWWKSYLRDKPKAEYLNWKTQYWKDLLRQIDWQPQPNAKVLDAGCGPAGIFTILDQQQVDALDPLLEAYESNLAHFQRSDYPNVQFMAQALESLKAEATYDSIFCLNAINHVADLEGALDRLVRAIRPGGHLILSIDAHNHAFFKHLFRLIPGDILHPHQYDLDEYQQMLVRRNGEIQKSSCLKKAFFFDYHILIAKF